MELPKHHRGGKIALLVLLMTGILVISGRRVMGQTIIKGTVYDKSQLFAMPGVSVMGTSGVGTMTDSTGHYSLRLNRGDSIYFSYLGKSTQRFPVKKINASYSFDMSLGVTIDSLPLVVVRPRAYRYDSAANREEYRRVFDFQRPDYLGPSNEGMGVGLNLDALFGAKHTREMLSLQARLLEEEREKYVDYKFNKTLVRKITGLPSPALEAFMKQYRPTYDYIRNCENDYEFYKYIKDCGIYFWQLWKEEHPG
jgi:hypothetical protein